MKNYLHLQNGSDVRGVALPGVEGEEVTLTPEAASDIAAAFAIWISEKTGKDPDDLEISVGTDSRLSANIIKKSVFEGLRKTGANCADCGIASTPAMFMSTVLPGCQFNGSIMITASHLPWNRNGLKFFSPSGGLEKKEIMTILELAAQLPLIDEDQGKKRNFNVIDPYSGYLRRIITDQTGTDETPLSGFKIAVDAGNGAGGFFAEKVLKPLGADISFSQFLEPDGRFPNHVPNPEDQTAMAAAKKMVTDNRCDLGLIFDTDVDRAGAVDITGEVFSRNRLIGLLAAIESRRHPGCTIVTDSVTSDQLSDFLTNKLGCIHHRYKRGYRNVINECIRLNKEGINCPIAIETSGHCAYAENYFLDDGAYLSCKLIIEMARLRIEGKTLSDVIRDLRDPLESSEMRLKIRNQDPTAYSKRILGDLKDYAKQKSTWKIAEKNYEGLRFSLPEFAGWFLLRASLHDPLLVLNIESDQENGVVSIFNDLKPFLDQYQELEIR